MPLVSMKEMLIKAKQNHYAVAQFNINNLEWIQAILTTCEEKKSPVILGVSEGAAKYMGGFETVVAMVTSLMKNYGTTIPVAIHLDHGSSYENCVKAIDAGFTSVMIDASHHPLEENIEITKKVVEYAHARNVSVEAELGIVGGQEDGVVGEVLYANPDECYKLVQETSIDCLAPALGSVHGPYKGEPKLGFEEMKKISEMLDLPLVLHGGSGIPEEQIKKAISLGTSKINVNTEKQIAFTTAVYEFLIKNKTTIYDPRKVLEPGKKAIMEVVKYKVDEFGSTNKA